MDFSKAPQDTYHFITETTNAWTEHFLSSRTQRLVGEGESTHNGSVISKDEIAANILRNLSLRLNTSQVKCQCWLSHAWRLAFHFCRRPPEVPILLDRSFLRRPCDIGKCSERFNNAWVSSSRVSYRNGFYRCLCPCVAQQYFWFYTSGWGHCVL